jgi:hypothetical protein
MILQLVAIWAIVIASVVWFVRDELRLRRLARLSQAARFYAAAPQYRHVLIESDPAVDAVRNRFIRELSQQGSPAAV